MAIEQNLVTPVLNEELLYRSVRDSGDHHGCDPDGRLVRVGNSAFNDPERKPSVDRALLREGGPKDSRFSQQDGIVTMGAGEVRSISTVVTNNKKAEPLHGHGVDVLHAPVEYNYAHAQIETAPHVASDGAWKKLKEALCRIAVARGWTYPPASVRKGTS